MRYRIEAPGQPVAYGEYRSEMECRDIVRRSGLAPDMSLVRVTALWPGQPEPPLEYSQPRDQLTLTVTVSVPAGTRSRGEALTAVHDVLARSSGDSLLLEDVR
jgi:hypothetical protein